MSKDKRSLRDIAELIANGVSDERPDDVMVTIDSPKGDGGLVEIRIPKKLFDAPEKTRMQILHKRRCAAAGWGSDGECNWRDCPQIRDGEPMKSGRHCPLDTFDEDD